MLGSRKPIARAARPRKVVCTIAHGPHRELLEISRPGLEQFAGGNGYELVAIEHRVAPERPASWGKVVLLHQLVQQYDLVLWIDADALFVDPTRDVASEIDPFRFLHLVSHQIGPERIYNCGVMALRGGAVSRRFLERVWNQHDLVYHEWWENAAVLRLLGIASSIRFVPSGCRRGWRESGASMSRGTAFPIARRRRR